LAEIPQAERGWGCVLRETNEVSGGARLQSTQHSPQANTTSLPLKRFVNAVANLFTKP
jgi:hypothetical protein